MNLGVLFQGLPGRWSGHPAEQNVSRLVNDSRQAGPDALFIAASGYVEDAHPFLEKAYENGCRLFGVEEGRAGDFAAQHPDASVFSAPDAHQLLASLACRFYDNPAMKFKLVGITGTSGKTTTAFAVYLALQAMGVKAGLIGTVEYRVGAEVIPAANTTPDLLELYALFSRMVAAGTEVCVMEVSSHSLMLGRVAGLPFDAGAFTNFSQDHLDFHKTMQEYLAAKLHILDVLQNSPKPAHPLLVNRDMPEYAQIEGHSRGFDRVRLLSFSVTGQADYCAREIALRPDGSVFTVNGHRVSIGMPGLTNVYNFTLALALIEQMGYPVEKALPAFETIRVPGRMESLPAQSGVHIIVDYAHKPDALQKVLQTLRATLPEASSLITVFGCGGDRDRTKRPLMGEIAARLSHHTIITSDNPRTEDPLAIIAEIEAGARQVKNARITVLPDRREAIRAAVAGAAKGDVVLIAGKGHEDYQITGKSKSHFSDREEGLEADRIRSEKQ